MYQWDFIIKCMPKLLDERGFIQFHEVILGRPQKKIGFFVWLISWYFVELGKVNIFLEIKNPHGPIRIVCLNSKRSLQNSELRTDKNHVFETLLIQHQAREIFQNLSISTTTNTKYIQYTTIPAVNGTLIDCHFGFWAHNDIFIYKNLNLTTQENILCQIPKWQSFYVRFAAGIVASPTKW